MYYKVTRYCRWCGKAYEPKKDIGKDGFCCNACRQAHFRAYKKYVTQKAIAGDIARRSSVTRQKKRKKKKP